MDSSKRFVTVVLAAGVVVLLAAIVLGERMGDRVMVEAADSGSLGTTPIVTPVPSPTSGPYGPDWKRTQALAAAPDPEFPDPRIPPKPLPTLAPSPTPSPTPKWTPNPNIPIWDQTPPPSGQPSPSPTPMGPGPSLSPAPGPSNV
jgi:hypothetical protein